MTTEPKHSHYDVEDGATYAGYEITEIGYHHEMDQVYVVYEGSDLPDGWEQLIFPAAGGYESPRIRDVPVDLVSPEEAISGETDGATEALKLYNLLERTGIEIYSNPK